MTSSKELIQSFYKSDALINSTVLKDFLHTDVVLDWNSSKGLVQMNYDSIIEFVKTFEKAYVRSKVRMTHLIEENNLVSVRYSHFVKTIENPREEMLLAHFIAIWEIKDNKLFRGYQMSQLG